MMVIAAWCAAVAWLMWWERESLAWTALIGVAPGALITAERLPWLLAALFSAVFLAMNRKPRGGVSDLERQSALVRFWQETAVLLTAGLTFWQAVEIAAEAEPWLKSTISEAAQRISRRSHAMPELGPLGPDAPLTWLLLRHGYLHGISSAQIQAHVRHLQTRLTYQEEAKKRHGPLWMTVLPAVLLLNVLWIFIAPMAALAGHGWIKVIR